VGEPVGKVTSVERDSFTLDHSAPLHSGDGLTFFGRDHQLGGSLVNRVEGRTVFLQKLDGLAAGARVFRNHDHAFAKQVAQSRPERRIAITLSVHETATGISLRAVDEDGVTAEAAIACEKVAATDVDKTNARTKQQLAKLGDSEFAACSIELRWSTPLHLPASQLNSLRRDVATKLAAARKANFPHATSTFVPNDAAFPTEKLSFLANVLNQKAAAFYRRHGVRDIDPAAESGIALGGQPLMTTRYCLKYEMGVCPREPRSQVEALPAEPWFLIDDEGRRFRLRFRCQPSDNSPCTMQLIAS
jgi:putative protease